MGLLGTYSTYVYTEHESETEEQEVVVPSDLREDQMYYENRGTTITIDVPVTVTTETTYENKYVHINSANVFLIQAYKDGVEQDVRMINFCYRTYSSKAAREADTTDFEFETHSQIYELPSGDRTEIQKAYDLLKLEPGFSNMTDD